MKGQINKSHYFSTLTLSFLLLFCAALRGQIKNEDKYQNIKNFEIIIVHSDYSNAYSVAIILTDKYLKIVYKSGLVGGKDTVLFSKNMELSDTLRQISELKLTKLKSNYTNECIVDGLQLTLMFKMDEKIKSVHVSNYYQEDIGKLIYLVNFLVPEKYKIWYDKESLIAEYKRCQGTK